MKDYYKILGIETNSDQITIKKSYRNLVRKLHPDKNPLPEAAKQFIEITEAYEVLKDSENRKEYDILYHQYFVKKDMAQNYHFTHEQVWEEHGKQKAKEYSFMPFDDFIRKIMDEIKTGSQFWIQMILLASCLFGVFSARVIFSIEPLFGIFYVVLYGTLSYLLFRRTRKEYTDSRKKKEKN